MENAYPKILGRNFLNHLRVQITCELGKVKVGVKAKNPVSGFPMLPSESPQEEATTIPLDAELRAENPEVRELKTTLQTRSSAQEALWARHSGWKALRTRLPMTHLKDL